MGVKNRSSRIEVVAGVARCARDVMFDGGWILYKTTQLYVRINGRAMNDF